MFPPRLKTHVLVCADIYLNVWALFGKKDGIIALIALTPAELQYGSKKQVCIIELNAKGFNIRLEFYVIRLIINLIKI